MTTLHQLTDNCIAVAGLPMDVYKEGSIKENSKGKYFQYFYKKVNCTHALETTPYLPTGNWRILGKANEFTEEQWKEVVEPSERSGMFKSYKEHFTNPYFFAYDTATESGASLLQSKGLYLVNPYSLPSCDCNTEYDREGCEQECYQYINANELSNPLILIKDLVI